MNSQKGITLITLVATIIILLILAAVSITLIIGPDGMIERSKSSKLDSRYASIIDKTKLREADLKISLEREEDGEHQKLFVERLIREGLIDPNDDYISEDYKTIFLGKISENDYKYTIDIAEARTKNSIVSDLIDSLPVVTETENNDMRYLTIIMKTFSSNETVTLPISNTTNLTINWDADKGNIFSNPNKSSNPTYTYAQAGEYKVQVKGQAQPGTSVGGDLDPSNIFSYYGNENMHALVYWGENGFTEFKALSNAFELGIPIPSKESFKNVTKFENTFTGRTYPIPGDLEQENEINFAKLVNLNNQEVYFENCIKEKMTVPENLFANATKVTSFKGLFTENLDISEIPANLFANAINAQDFSYAFSYCLDLNGIPKGLFAYNRKVTNFTGLFENSDLSGKIPADLFANCPNATDFTNLFRYNRNLSGSIPADLFKNNTKATSFTAVFYDCKGLTGNIPPNLFANNPNVTSFWGVFDGCEGLTGSIPSTLFANNTNVTNFGYTFADCSGLTGNIPPNLFSNNTKVVTFESMFRSCTGLTGDIPSSLFANCPDVKEFGGTFAYCAGLKNLPIDLFDNNQKVTSFSTTFFFCTGLTGNAPNLWSRSGIQYSTWCFSNCKSLSNFNSIPSKWK